METRRHPLLPHRLQFATVGLLSFFFPAVVRGADTPNWETYFTTKVQPILEEHCTECHGADKQKARLRLDSAQGISRGGESGEPLLVPGSGAGSYLVKRVEAREGREMMPPKGERLSSAEVEVLRTWIDHGALMPGVVFGAQTTPPKTEHWSFQPVRRPEVPRSGSAFVRNPVDEFVLEKLRAKGLQPSPEADRNTLIRRVYLIMHGLPPTPAEVEAFVGDAAPDAYERLVDRVLQSPRYGERWARHWMDVVRYADTDGFERNVERKTAYPYRDYLIEAFNTDKPYDRFVREQLAGDVENVDAATGFLVAGPWDSVRSADKNLTLMQRQEELADIVNTTGTTFLGLTLGCARCHNHKFDPVTQQDYYAMQAVFAGVIHAERPLREKVTPETQKEVAASQRELGQKLSLLEQWKRKAQDISAVASGLDPKTAREPVGAKLNTETFEPIETTALRLTISESILGPAGIDELEVFDVSGANVALSSNGGRATASSVIPGYAIHRIEHLNDGKFGNLNSWVANAAQGWVRIDFPNPKTIQRVVWSRDREGRLSDRVVSRYTVEVLAADGSWKAVASAAGRRPPVLPLKGKTAKGDEILAQLPEADRVVVDALQKDIESIRSKLAALQPVARVGRFEPKPARTHRLYRGEPNQPREEVAPAGLAVVGGLNLEMDAIDEVRRKSFAEWITRPDNPLTARVLVNRLWHYVFGTGIVDTPSDFGANGGRPTHPELLDWLADELVRGGWSIKNVQRALLLSATFRQSSEPRSEALAVDSDSRLLWRFAPRRLEAEAIRDSILAVSGKLDLSMGGAGFMLVDAVIENVRHYFPKEKYTEADFRRMVYMFRVRAAQDAVFGAFDCPDGGSVMARRSRSTTPLQALNLFNSTFVSGQSEFLAERLRREVGESPDAQVRAAFGLVYARQPDAFEVEASRKLLQAEGLTAFTRGLLNTSEFLFIF